MERCDWLNEVSRGSPAWRDEGAEDLKTALFRVFFFFFFVVCFDFENGNPFGKLLRFSFLNFTLLSNLNFKFSPLLLSFKFKFYFNLIICFKIYTFFCNVTCVPIFFFL